MTRSRKALTHILITAIFFYGLLAGAVPDIHAATPRGNFFYGNSAITGKLQQGDRLFFGQKVAAGYTGKQLWRIGNPKGSNTDASGAMLLISEYTWRGPSSSLCFNKDVNSSIAQKWEGSNAQSWCKGFYNSCFTADEKATYEEQNNPYFEGGRKNE